MKTHTMVLTMDPCRPLISEGHYRQGYGPLLEGFISLGTPYRAGADREEAERLLAEELVEWLRVHGEKMSALLIEPVIGSGGVIVPPAKYMEILRDYCEAHRILIICDEIACGFSGAGEREPCSDFSVLVSDRIL